MLHKNKFQEKGNGFQFANSGGISDTTLLSIATAYKTGVSRKYKTLPARLLEQTFASASAVAASTKYDGEGVFFYYEEGEPPVAFNAPSGRARVGLPWMADAASKLQAAGIKKALIPGEIYLKANGSRSRSGDVIHITINGTQEERTHLAFAAYDVIMLDGKDRREDQKAFGANWETLKTIFGTDPTESSHRADGAIIPGREVNAYFEKVTKASGGEGIVVRYPAADGIFKIKPSLTIDVTVIGYVEGDFEEQYGVMSLLCALCGPDGKTLQVFSRVGSGFDDNLRAELLPELAALKVDAPLRMSDSSGRPITFVKPKLVVEIEGEALIETNLEGKETTSQTVSWDGENYQFLAINSCPRLSHATLAKIRTDKSWNDGGTRMEQALSGAAIANILAPKSKAAKTPTITLREVFTKTGKEGVSVRKIVVIERDAPNFHRYTVHWTDFSPGRKDPFKNEVACADSKTRLEEVIAEYQEEAGKRGWVKKEAA